MAEPGDLVRKRERKDGRKETTCYCDAAPYPHRLGSVEGCYGDSYCHHGNPLPGHPDWEGRCPDCDREEWGDILFDRMRDT